jgi:hypothetical protein
MEEPLAMESIRQVAKDIAPDQVNVVASVDKTTVEYGNPITVSATLTIKDKSPLVNVPVRIEGKSLGDSNWRLLATTTTGQDGRVEKPLIIGKSTSIRIYSDPTWERTEGASTEMAVTVNRVLSLNAPATVRSNESATVTGFIRPRIAGAYIQLETQVSGVWQTLGVPVSTDTQGAFVITIPARNRGVLTLRASIAADAQWNIVTSPTFNIIIR